LRSPAWGNATPSGSGVERQAFRGRRPRLLTCALTGHGNSMGFSAACLAPPFRQPPFKRGEICRLKGGTGPSNSVIKSSSDLHETRHAVAENPLFSDRSAGFRADFTHPWEESVRIARKQDGDGVDPRFAVRSGRSGHLHKLRMGAETPARTLPSSRRRQRGPRTRGSSEP